MPSHAKLVERFPLEMGKRKDITKLLGIPFGLGLEVNDINAFLLNKVKKKLSFGRDAKYPHRALSGACFSCLLAHVFQPCLVLHRTMQHGSTCSSVQGSMGGI